MVLGVVVFPGSNCDRDVQWAAEGCLGIQTRFLWHEERDLSGLDAVVIPGGFSYGDYLRCGAIARFAPVLQEVVQFAERAAACWGFAMAFRCSPKWDCSLVRSPAIRSCTFSVNQRNSPLNQEVAAGYRATAAASW